MGDRSGRSTFVEDHDPGVPVAKELGRDQRQQCRLAGTGRSDDHGVADIAGMQVQMEGCRTLGLGDQQRWRIEMRVPDLTGPDCGERQHVGEIQR